MFLNIWKGNKYLFLYRKNWFENWYKNVVIVTVVCYEEFKVENTYNRKYKYTIK